MAQTNIGQLLAANEYPGRGIALGLSDGGGHAAMAYFIMGRSENSRNRIFVTEGENLRTQAFDPAKLEDPSLVIYAPVRVLNNQVIVTNGDQTDTIYEFLQAGRSFADALRTRSFEPDPPIFSPRISGLLTLRAPFRYHLSILKCEGNNPATQRRFFFEYDSPLPGQGHFVHTYQGNGDPVPSFEGEPRTVAIPRDIDEFTRQLWENLHGDNKVSLFVRYISLSTGESQTRICNKLENA